MIPQNHPLDFLKTLFFDAFLPTPKPASAIIIPRTPAAQRIRRKRKIVRSKRGD